MQLNEWERASLIAMCDAKVAEYIAHRQNAIWRHRAQNFDPVPGTLCYEVIKRARGRCEACGVSNQERALQVDHIMPRTKGGSNDLSNLQALCSACNAPKHGRDMTDFHAAHEAYELRDPDCLFCTLPSDRISGQAGMRVLLAALAKKFCGPQIALTARPAVPLETHGLHNHCIEVNSRSSQATKERISSTLGELLCQAAQ